MTDTAYLTTTLTAIRKHSPCEDGWEKLLKHLGKTKADDEPLALVTVLDSNGLQDALWCLRAVDGHEREMRLFAVFCARRVQHQMTDTRSLAALDVAERHAAGLATSAELAAVSAAAWDAAGAAASDAAWAAASAAHDAAAAGAAVAAYDAARDAAWAASCAAARIYHRLSYPPIDAARDAATLEFRRRFGSGVTAPVCRVGP